MDAVSVPLVRGSGVGTRGLYSDFVLPSRWKISGQRRCRLLVGHACTDVEDGVADPPRTCHGRVVDTTQGGQ